MAEERPSAVWANVETGELVEGECPFCAATKLAAEEQIRAMERERRADRSARTKAEKAAERQVAAKQDGALWVRVRDFWLETFPDKRPTALGPTSARALAVFARLGQQASEENVKDAIRGAKEWPFVVYGRRQRRGSASDRADDLQLIMHLGRDDQFDFLVEEGLKIRKVADEW